jgi:hypothetical protein
VFWTRARRKRGRSASGRRGARAGQGRAWQGRGGGGHAQLEPVVHVACAAHLEVSRVALDEGVRRREQEGLEPLAVHAQVDVPAVCAVAAVREVVDVAVTVGAAEHRRKSLAEFNPAISGHLGI